VREKQVGEVRYGESKLLRGDIGDHLLAMAQI